MPRAAVLGKPVAHSLSPVIHRAGYTAAGLADWSYTAIECGEVDLPGLVAGLGPQWAGLSLTMPLKEVSLAVADEAAPLAAQLGAANTLVRLPDGGWRAENTDAVGIAAALTAALAGTTAGRATAGRSGGRTPAAGSAMGPGLDHPPVTGAAPPAGSAVAAGAAGDPPVAHGEPAAAPRLTERTPVVVLGAGGTARAALGAATQLGVRQVTVVARRAAALAALEPVAAALGLSLVSRLWPAATEEVNGAQVVVSTLPAGAADPLADRVVWRPGAVLLDALYHPWPTPLAASAAAAGVRVASGLDLLLAQAVEQFRLFTGVPAPVEAMRAALAAA